VSCQGEGVAQGTIIPEFLTMEKLAENLLLVEKRASRMQNLQLKTRILGNFLGKMEILSNHKISSDRNLFVAKLQLFVPPTFLNDDAAGVGPAPLNPRKHDSCAVLQTMEAQAFTRKFFC